MDSRRIKDMTERQFRRALEREGKAVVKSLTQENVTVLFREVRGSSGEHISIYYAYDANLKKGDIVEYKGYRYLLANENSTQSDVFKLSTLKRCTVEFSIYGRKVPMAFASSDVFASNFGSTLLENIGLVTTDNNIVRSLERSTKYICFGSVYMIKNMFYNDGLAYILLERSGNAAYGLKEIKYYGGTSLALEEQKVYLPFEVVTTLDDFVWIEAKIEYTSSNPDIATVDENGWLTLKKKGIIIVTATCEEITIKKTITIR
jgi:hypothetical protein